MCARPSSRPGGERAAHDVAVRLLAGVGRVVWGRLDEVQPTDVINPLDVSRFFFEGRSEARLPVAVIRARAFLSEEAAIEGVYVPFFRRGRFDQLDEPTSPFNPGPGVCAGFRAPRSSGGSRRRRSATRRAAHGSRPPRAASIGASPGIVASSRSGSGPCRRRRLFQFTIVYPRYTMIGGDFETVRGPWGLRGEVAAFVDDNFQHGS